MLQQYSGRANGNMVLPTCMVVLLFTSEFAAAVCEL